MRSGNTRANKAAPRARGLANDPNPKERVPGGLDIRVLECWNRSFFQSFVIVLENGAVFERQLPGEVFVQGCAVAASEHFLLATPALRFGAGQGAGLE